LLDKHYCPICNKELVNENISIGIRFICYADKVQHYKCFANNYLDRMEIYPQSSKISIQIQYFDNKPIRAFCVEFPYEIFLEIIPDKNSSGLEIVEKLKKLSLFK